MKISARLARRLIVALCIVAVLITPGLILKFSGAEIAPLASLLIYGIAVIAASFALAWTGEAAEKDISGGLMVGLLAITAILPEYAVDLYFAFSAGSDPSLTQYAAANMTGANRLLLGVAWPLMVLVAWLVYRSVKRKKAAVDPDIETKPFAVVVRRGYRLELGLLIIATVLALLIPLTGQINILLGVAMLGLFVFYLYRASKSETEEPELMGVSESIGALSTVQRRIMLVVLFVGTAAVILMLAEPFAQSLIAAGRQLGISDFLLVQWLAPLASEAPEFVIAILFAMRGKAGMALGLLIASKVNQWTALVGSLPVAYMAGGGGWAMPMDPRQVEEFTLTAAQTLLGISILLCMKFSGRWATVLFLLFTTTFIFTSTEARYLVAAGYTVLAVVLLVAHRRAIWPTVKMAVTGKDSDDGFPVHLPGKEHRRGMSRPVSRM